MKERLLGLNRNKWKLKSGVVPGDFQETEEELQDDVIVIKPNESIAHEESTKETEEQLQELQDDVIVIEPNESIAHEESTKEEELLALRTVIAEKDKINIEQEKQIHYLNSVIQTQLKQIKSVEKIFTAGQVKKLKTGKRIRWDTQDIISAISLYAGGPRSYRLLQKRGYPLPAVCTLRRWASKVKIRPGILDIIISLMKNTTLTRTERACILLFDEMKIQSVYAYDKLNDTLMAPTNYVQVVMARGICKNWKQPIFYDYDCKMTKIILFRIITVLENIGYPVYAINCDLGGTNRSLMNSLNISPENSCFSNPVTKNYISNYIYNN